MLLETSGALTMPTARFPTYEQGNLTVVAWGNRGNLNHRSQEVRNAGRAFLREFDSSWVGGQDFRQLTLPILPCHECEQWHSLESPDGICATHCVTV